MKDEIKKLIEEIDNKIEALSGAFALYKQQGMEKESDSIKLVAEAYADVRQKLFVIAGGKVQMKGKIINLKQNEDGK